jgi:hypothetical protein
MLQKPGNPPCFEIGRDAPGRQRSNFKTGALNPLGRIKECAADLVGEPLDAPFRRPQTCVIKTFPKWPRPSKCR